MVWPVSVALEALPMGWVQPMWTPTEHEPLNQVTAMLPDVHLFLRLSNHGDCCGEPRRRMADTALRASCGPTLSPL